MDIRRKEKYKTLSFLIRAGLSASIDKERVIYDALKENITIFESITEGGDDTPSLGKVDQTIKELERTAREIRYANICLTCLTNLSIKTTAKEYGISKAVVYRALKRHDMLDIITG